LRHLLQFIGCARYLFFIDDVVCWRTWRLTRLNLLKSL
jgi:hypothetical protein